MFTNGMRDAIAAMKSMGTDGRITSIVEGAADEIDRLRARLEQAERERDQWKLKVCDWQDEHSKVEKHLERAEGLVAGIRPFVKDPNCCEVLGLGFVGHRSDAVDRIDAFLRGEDYG